MSDLNDPRVFFAAERTLLAWNRTGRTLMAFAVIGFSIVQFRQVPRTLKPTEIPARYCTWSGIAMNLSVVVLGFALLVYLFSEL